MPPELTDEKQKEVDRGDFIDDPNFEEIDPDDDDDDKDDEDVEDEEDTEDEDTDEEEDGEDESEEEEDEEEDDAEDTDEDDEEDDEEASGNDQHVPLSRLNRVIEQREKAKQRNAWLEDQVEKLLEAQFENTTPDTPAAKDDDSFNVREAEKKYSDLMLEGEGELAAELRIEIKKEEDRQLKVLLKDVATKAAENARKEATSSVEEDRFTNVVQNFENKYPFLDVDSDEYNEEAVETVNALMVGIQTAEGITKTAAIKKAITKVAPMYEKPAAPGKADTKKRAKQGRKRNAKAVKQTPQKLKGKHNRVRDVSDMDLNKMSEKEYDKLTAKERAELRGDFVG